MKPYKKTLPRKELTNITPAKIHITSMPKMLDAPEKHLKNVAQQRFPIIELSHIIIIRPSPAKLPAYTSVLKKNAVKYANAGVAFIIWKALKDCALMLSMPVLILLLPFDTGNALDEFPAPLELATKAT